MDVVNEVKYNRLNKFLSYIHMGNEVFRVYYKHAENVQNKELKRLIVDIQEVFKNHEEKITKLIALKGCSPTDTLTIQGKMGVFMESLKVVDDSFAIALDALKAVNMGEVSALKFLKENQKMDNSIKDDIKKIITDYDEIKTKIKNFIFRHFS